MAKPLRLVLGSGSPRRKELLAQIGIIPDEIRAPDIDEAPRPGELPRSYCMRIALEKVQALEAATDEVVLCADTTVALGRRILGKPADVAEAAAFLDLLSGRRHRVITSVAVQRRDRTWQRTVVSKVRMKRLSKAELDHYLQTSDWQGKAGAYAIQGPAAAFIPWISGSFSAIVGLPVAEAAQLLQAAGYPIYQAPE